MVDINIVILFLIFILFYLYTFDKKNIIIKDNKKKDIKEEKKIVKNNKIIEGPYVDRSHTQITRNTIIHEKGGSKPYNNIVLDNKNLDNDIPDYKKAYSSYRRKSTLPKHI